MTVKAPTRTLSSAKHCGRPLLRVRRWRLHYFVDDYANWEREHAGA